MVIVSWYRSGLLCAGAPQRVAESRQRKQQPLTFQVTPGNAHMRRVRKLVPGKLTRFERLHDLAVGHSERVQSKRATALAVALQEIGCGGGI